MRQELHLLIFSYYNDKISMQGKIRKMGTYEELSETELAKLYPESPEEEKSHDAEHHKRLHHEEGGKVCL